MVDHIIAEHDFEAGILERKSLALRLDRRNRRRSLPREQLPQIVRQRIYAEAMLATEIEDDPAAAATNFQDPIGRADWAYGLDPRSNDSGLFGHGCSELRLAPAPLLGEAPHVIELPDARPRGAIRLNRGGPAHPCP